MSSLSSSAATEQHGSNKNANNIDGAEAPLQKRLLTPFMNKRVPPVPTEEERKVYPLHYTNIISKIFFWWIVPLMKVGYKRTLQPLDLWYLDEKLQVEYYYQSFTWNLEKQLRKSKLAHQQEIELKGDDYDPEEDEFEYPKFAVLKALLHEFFYEYAMCVILMIISEVASVLNPLLTKALINFVEKRALGLHVTISKGVGYAIGCSLMLLAEGILMNHSMHLSMMVGAKVKAVLTKAILEKSFKLNSKGRHKFPDGKITSLMSTDLARIDLAIGIQQYLFSFPVPTIIAIAMLIVNIGVSSLAGVALFVLSLGIIGYCSTFLFKFRTSVVKQTDMRVGYMKELLNYLKIIKFYCWEDSYLKSVTEVRRKEMNILMKIHAVRGFIISLAITLPQIASMVAFLVMYAVSNNKNAADIFSSLTYFNVLATQLFMIPMTISSSTDALIGFKRVTLLLQCGEVSQEEQNSYYEHTEDLEKENLALKTVNASFEWRTFHLDDEELKQLEEKKLAKSKEEVEKQEDEPKAGESKPLEENSAMDQTNFKGLNNISLSISKGEFVIITGTIGTGKSSLLSALAGFMPKTSGQLQINGSLLSCGQPWVQNATVRENILFGSELDEKKYNQVISACALNADLDILLAGDSTEVGERGITLSGGQKLRINLARAVYADCDIILLDDVLSAVDAKVGKHIMDNCMMGLLAQKTRVLATHQLSLIGNADRVIFLDGDGSVNIGTVDELRQSNSGFEKLMSYNAEVKDEEIEEDLENVEEEEIKLVKQQTIQEKEFKIDLDEDLEDGILTTIEDRAVNQIGFQVYKRYISAGSGVFKSALVPIILLIVILATFFQLFTNTWLSFWTDYKFKNRSNGFYIGIYIMVSFMTVICVTVEFILIAYLANGASKKLNIKAVQKILRVPMSYMDTTPMGRILNRFTKDTDALDNELTDQLITVTYTLANTIGVLILCVIYLPWFAIAIPFLAIVFVCITSMYQASAREIKRLELIQRSFVYNNFNETLSGSLTIRAYKLEQRFINKNNNLLNGMNEAYFLTIANQRWLSINLNLLSTVFSLLISLLCVTRQFRISAASTGLLLSYILEMVSQVSMLIRSITQVENEMNSVERVCHYAYELQQELAFEISDTKPRPEWPEEGQISFQDVSLRYREGLPLVLKSLDMKVGAGEKIGICGRTGAGKSSIMTALYRISELSSGTIHIDGVDISKIGLHDLRSKLSIIPQDPVLLRGTIRKNLDPFNDHSDEKLWHSLHKSGLIDDIESAKTQGTGELHKFHLDQVVEDDGANFSLGERQLIALTRAVVRDSKILILDEATSSVDYETDSKIQSTIVKEFGDCTILCIAHRLKTIVNYDKILVLDKGEVREFDTPWNLFNLDGGIFQSMCEKSSILKSDFMRKD